MLRQFRHAFVVSEFFLLEGVLEQPTQEMNFIAKGLPNARAWLLCHEVHIKK